MPYADACRPSLPDHNLSLPVNYDDPATEILAKKEWLIWVREQHKRALTEVSDQQLAKGDLYVVVLLQSSFPSGKITRYR